jgi:hypothetical protein
MIGAITAGLFSTGAAAGGGTAYESIATVTVGSGGSSSISFSSIPSGFKHLQIRFSAASANSDVGLVAQFNGDTSTNYGAHFLYGTGSAAGASGDTPRNNIYASSGLYPTYFSAGVLDILEYGNTNTYKTTRSLTGADRNGSGIIWLFSGAWRSTSAISSISLNAASGNIAEYSKFALYGIKG